MALLHELRALLREDLDLDVEGNAFLATLPPERVEKTKKALAALLVAYQAGTIFNTDFKMWKLTVDRSFEDGFNHLVRTDYTTYWEPDQKTVSPKGMIADGLGFASGIRSSIALQKQANKLKIAHPHLDEVKKFLATAVPIAQIFEKLKTMVVKGKKPLSPEKAAVKATVLAKKTVKTCGCCFRPIAVIPNGKIADHGYSLPHPGNKSMSCPGRKFRPLEVTDDGLKYMVDLYLNWVEQEQAALKNAPSLMSLHKKSFSLKKQGELVVKGHPEWEATYRAHVAELKGSLDRDEGQLKMFKHKLASWKPVTESIRDLARDLRLVV